MINAGNKRGFTSLRKKLVIKLGITYLLALVFVFVLIIVKNTIDFNATIAETQIRLTNSLNNKGMLLIKNNSNALAGLVEDNAFNAVEQIVANTVRSSKDIVYGVFSDRQKNDWVFTFHDDTSSVYQVAVEANSEWAQQQTVAASSSIMFNQLKVIEFAAPVMIDGQSLGVIRYGLSTVELTETIAAANQQATVSLMQTLFALIAVGIVTLLVVFWRTDKVAKHITVPLNVLTDAANIVASGQYEQAINIETNDEIGILAQNFDSMTNIIKRTIADLAKINQVGSALASTWQQQQAVQLVLEALLLQLPFRVAVLFQQDETNRLSLLGHFQTQTIEITDVHSLIAEHSGIKQALAQSTTDSSAQIFVNIAQLNATPALQSLIFMPFGLVKDKPLYLALLAQHSIQEIESSELEFCMSIRNLLVTSLKNIAMNELLAEQNKNLEQKVQQRTQELHQQNTMLSTTLTELEQAQEQLIESEKLASLGSLVAGISHEVNTPLGVSVTAASHLHKQTRQFEQKFSSGDLTKSGFITYMKSATETTEIILANLERASTLIQSFKQIAVDQNSDNLSKFDLKRHLDMLIVSLKPSYKTLPITINLTGENFEIHSYPGLLNQVVSNLIINSIKHGLEHCEQGMIDIQVSQDDAEIQIVVSDNGVGIPDDIKGKVFDPFFTTKRGTGGSGLGLNIVYNIIKQKLGGEIEIEDNKPQGTKFIINLPLLDILS
jgi:signal transduction histidine kinase/HAMP domain-containing protein